jgi:hypothetical protein
MKRELTLYYASRAVLAALFGVAFTLGGWPWWAGLAMGVVVFAGFIWYAHSGRYLIDSSTPLFPLRRDARGKSIRDRAVVAAVVVGGLTYVVLSLAALTMQLPFSAGMLTLTIGAATYFVISNWLYVRH